ncbi:ectoine/hydroxyectoine ABC transporter, permease protein EhuD [compost metagenome]
MAPEHTFSAISLANSLAIEASLAQGTPACCRRAACSMNWCATSTCVAMSARSKATPCRLMIGPPYASRSLAYCTAAYTSEIIRGGIESVAAGQTEAAEVIGLNRFDALRFVILPQALRVALPSLLGFSIMMFQASSLCFTIALPEIVSRASSIGSSTFEYMPVLILAGLMYAAVCAPATLGVAALEKRLAPSQP